MRKWKVGDLGIATISAGRVIEGDVLRIVWDHRDDRSYKIDRHESDDYCDLKVRIEGRGSDDLGWQSMNLKLKTGVCGECEQAKVMDYDQYICDDCVYQSRSTC